MMRSGCDPSPASAAKMRSKTPIRLQRKKRVAWHVNVRMRLFQPDVAFKDENPTDGILKLTATAKTPPNGMYGS